MWPIAINSSFRSALVPTETTHVRIATDKQLSFRFKSIGCGIRLNLVRTRFECTFNWNQYCTLWYWVTLISVQNVTLYRPIIKKKSYSQKVVSRFASARNKEKPYATLFLWTMQHFRMTWRKCWLSYFNTRGAMDSELDVCG